MTNRSTHQRTASADAPFKPLFQKPPQVDLEERSDGSILLRSRHPLKEVPASLIHLLAEKARLHPDRPLLAERAESGRWRTLSYGELNQQSDAVASYLLANGHTTKGPLMVLSDGSCAHAVMMVGAMKALIPVVPVSVPYSLSDDLSKLRTVVEATQPSIVFAEDGDVFAGAIEAVRAPGRLIVTASGVQRHPGSQRLSDMTKVAVEQSIIDRSAQQIGPNTVARYSFTSGSTGVPKAVIMTHGMLMGLVASLTALNDYPTSPDHGPKTMDWMPWSHGSALITLLLMMNGGGTLYLDRGKPREGEFDETISNLRELSPPAFSSPPIAYAALVEQLEQDSEFRAEFFRTVHQLNYGSAALSRDLCERLQRMSIAETGYRTPITTVYGSTEAGCVSSVHWPTDQVGLIGLPLPGVTLKLVPLNDRYEIRARGPSTMPGYFNDPEATAAVFDEEGFVSLGDAAQFVDWEAPEAGLRFAGRIRENFKLSTGTWVAASVLRTDAIAACSPLLRDVVVCGADRPYVGLLAWPNAQAIASLLGADRNADAESLLQDGRLRGLLRERIALFNETAGGSSRRIGRLLILTEPPSLAHREITEKGSINQGAVLARRSDLVERLYAEPSPDEVIVI